LIEELIQHETQTETSGKGLKVNEPYGHAS